MYCQLLGTLLKHQQYAYVFIDSITYNFNGKELFTGIIYIIQSYQESCYIRYFCEVDDASMDIKIKLCLMLSILKIITSRLVYFMGVTVDSKLT